MKTVMRRPIGSWHRPHGGARMDGAIQRCPVPSLGGARMNAGARPCPVAGLDPEHA
jgi:hypothetical protein